MIYTVVQYFLIFCNWFLWCVGGGGGGGNPRANAATIPPKYPSPPSTPARRYMASRQPDGAGGGRGRGGEGRGGVEKGGEGWRREGRGGGGAEMVYRYLTRQQYIRREGFSCQRVSPATTWPVAR